MFVCSVQIPFSCVWVMHIRTGDGARVGVCEKFPKASCRPYIAATFFSQGLEQGKRARENEIQIWNS